MDEIEAPVSGPARKFGPPSTAIAWVKKRWGLAVAVVVPVVSVATLVIPLIADASTFTTSVDTLVVGGTDATAAPAVGAEAAVNSALSTRELIGESIPESFPNAYWRVAADAPWETFPLEPITDSSCSANQIAWLLEWGHRQNADIWNGYLTLENTATDGSSMSVRDIHSIGTFITPPSPEVKVECNLGIGGYSEIIPLQQELGSDAPATFLANYGSASAGTPATLNIAPGQYLQLSVNFVRAGDPTADFSGSLVADVVVGDQTTQVLLFDGFTRAGRAAITTTSLNVFGDVLSCGPTATDPCTIAEFLSQLKADPGYNRRDG